MQAALSLSHMGTHMHTHLDKLAAEVLLRRAAEVDEDDAVAEALGLQRGARWQWVAERQLEA